MKITLINVGRYTAALLLLLGFSTACNNDILDQRNPNFITPDQFYQTEDDAVKAIIGAYSPLTEIFNYTRMNVFATVYRSDAVNGFATSERTAPATFNTESNRNMVIWSWAPWYKIISRTNLVLDRVPSVEMDETIRQNILGEAHFLRAYSYFQLLRNYRNVLLITEPIGLDEARTLTQASPEATYQQIINDFKMAQSMLPDEWDDSNTGRATSGAATGMLARAYLSELDYANARPELLKIIESGRYELMADYNDNFQEATDNNAESLFEIQLVADGNFGWGGDAAGLGKGAGYMQDLAPTPAFTGQDGMRMNDWVLDLFLDERTVNDEVDPRALMTLFWPTDETTTYEGRELRSMAYGQSYRDAYATGDLVFNTKYLDFEAGYETAALGWHFSGNNVRILRYADILLMFAEAEFNLNGSTDAALDAINQVRARVDMPAFTEITMQDIMDERVKELTVERERYYDLLRWGLVEERIVNRPEVRSEAGGTGAFRPGREYFDIPDAELNNNPNLMHNPGYQ